MRVALDHERQRIEHGPDHGRIVLAECLGGDERAHVEEPIRFARLVAVDHSEIRSDRLARIERHGEREEQAVRRRLEGAVGGRKEPRDQCFERLLAVAQLFGHARADFASAVARVEPGGPLQKRHGAIDPSSRQLHVPPS